MNNNKAAFTLIELLMVIILLAVIIGLSVPNFGRSMDSFELKKTTNDIVYLVRWAQARSINENVNYQFVFLDNFRNYRVLKDKSSNGGKEDFVPIMVHMGRTIEVPKSVKISADKDFFKINHDGSLEKIEIRVEGKNGVYLLSSKIQRGNLLLIDNND